MAEELIPFTKDGYQTLQDELYKLKHTERPKIIQDIADARAHGDLSENAEYHGARESQGLMQAKINMLRDKLARAVIVERQKEATNEVVFGSTVVVRDLKFGDDEIFVLVGAGEEDYDAGKINVASPLAQGLLGRKVGEKVSIDVPAGTMKFEIKEVRFED